MTANKFWWMQTNEQKHGWTELSRSGWYNTSEWKQLRKLALSKNPLCELCEKEGKLTPAKEVNHIIPATTDKSKFFNLENLQPLCTYHHRSITRKDNSRFSRLEEGKKLQQELESD